MTTLIPVQVGLDSIDLSQQSVQLLIAALDDYTDGDLPPDLMRLCQLLSSLSR